jgi:hypothetical protein
VFNLNRICLEDGSENLEFRFEKIVRTQEEKELERFFKIAKFQKTGTNEWTFPSTEDQVKFIKKADSIIKKCSKLNIKLDVCKNLSDFMNVAKNDINFKDVLPGGKKIKDFCPICDQKWTNHDDQQLIYCRKKYPYPNLSSNFTRPLNDEQKKSVDHMLHMGNSANFSVPGSGKTTITYAALSRWLDDGIINKILVIGPTPSFFPWEDEYRECFGKEPNVIRPKGSEVDKLDKFNCELFLIHFATVMGKTQKIIDFLKNPKNNVAVIIDESHNIKNIDDDAKWATAVRQIAPFAKRKIILSGTPMPNGAKDLWIQINFLWPHENLLCSRRNFKRNTERHGIRDWKSTIDPLFTRITKQDLELNKPEFRHYYVNLKSDQQEIYTAIRESTLQEITSYTSKHKMQQYRKAKLIRMLQVASNPSLLYKGQNEEFNLESQCGLSSTHSIEPLEADIYKKIINYSNNSLIPAKLVQTAELAKKLMAKGEKVIIWSNFVINIRLFENQLLKDQNPIVIYGDISTDIDKEENRDKSIKKFKDAENACVLIATPPTLSESVSLHIDKNKKRVCSHAIYLDRNYNAAQYVQSMDRIHRVNMDLSDNSSFTIEIENSGVKEERTFRRDRVYYHFIIANDTIDESINERLNKKFENMNSALNDPWPTTLDYDGNSVNSVNVSDDSAKNDLISLVTSLQNTVESNTNDN